MSRHKSEISPRVRVIQKIYGSLFNPDEIINYVSNQSLNNKKIYLNQLKSKLDDSIKIADVLYVTRIQKERFDCVDTYNKVKDSYIIDNNILKNALKKMIIMHPLPRNNEIAKEVDNDPRAAYFRQMKNGLYVRMGLLLEYM